jgi:CheY-like chemotaxis protein
MEKKSFNRKIVLIDDDSDDRKYFAEALHEIDSSIELVTAKDGEQALNLLKQPGLAIPNFIFLDLRMPRVNGRQCLLQIKADVRLKDIPVVIYTTSKEIREADELLALGAVHFITKPSDPEEIYYVLSMVLEEKWSDAGWQKFKS